MPSSHHHDDISFISCFREFRGYTLGLFRQDAVAGLAVALLAVPQAIAYAIAAGLPPSAGLLSTIFATMITAAFGSSRHLVVGPSNAVSILIQASTAEILYTYYRDVDPASLGMITFSVMIQLTFIVGFMQVLAAVFKLGRLSQFVSHSVVVAYLAGTVLALLINQSFTLLGIPMGTNLNTLYDKGMYLTTHLHHVHCPTAIVGGACVVLYIILKAIGDRTRRAFPAPLITLVFATTLVGWMGLTSPNTSSPPGQLSPNQVLVVGDEGDVQTVRPIVEVPFFNMSIINKLLPVAFAISLLGILETSSVTKTIAASSGQRLSINQELFGLGLGNLVGSFVGAMPASGSPSRSLLNYHCGAETRLSAMLSGVCIALILLFFGSWVAAIPLTALAALLVVTAVKLIDRHQLLLCLKATRSDALVLLTTFVACLFFTIDIAFYIGVIISITLYLKKASSPHLREYTLHDVAHPKTTADQKHIRVINVEGELFFGAADLLQTALKAIAEDDANIRVIILRLKNARDIDATACLALQHLYDYLDKAGKHLIACGIRPSAWDVLCDSGIVEKMGKNNLFIYDERNPQQSLHKALIRAREMMAADDARKRVPIRALTDLLDVTPVKLETGDEALAASER